MNVFLLIILQKMQNEKKSEENNNINIDKPTENYMNE